MKTDSRFRTMLIGGATVLTIAVTAVPASAVDDTQPADNIAAVIADAAPTLETVATPDTVTTSEVTFTGLNDVTVPIDADEPVTIESADSSVEIALPTEIDVSDGVVADDGTVVFEDNGNDAHAAVQALDDGSVRLQTVLESPDAPSTYTYTFSDGAELVLLDDGSVEVTETIADGVVAVIGLIEAPWAIDASGTNISTHYTVDGNALTQHVEHSREHAYPITADPKTSSTWWNRTVYFNKSETIKVAAGAGSSAWIASLFGIPGKVVGKVLAGYASAFGLYLAWGKCGKLVMYGASGTPAPQPHWGSEAGGYCK